MFIKSKSIYTDAGCRSGILEIEGKQIRQVLPYDCEVSGELLDVGEHRILPGIIDIHTHGFRGCNAQSLDKQELIELCELMASVGVTAFLPTAGEHFEGELTNLKLLKELIEQPVPGARMLGIHMEGPFLNPDRKGAFTNQQLLPCSIAKAQEYIEASGHHILYMSLAPELDPNGELIQYLNKQGMVVAGGHTCATFEEFAKGIDFGIRASTHTGNGMKQMDRRDPGAMGCALLSEQIYNEVICDFHHIAPEMLKIMFRIKENGVYGMIMISDSGQLSGNPPGVYEKYGQVRIIDEAGMIHLEDGTIAGSAHPMLMGIKNLEEKLSIRMEDILYMTAKNPAALFGIADQKGSIAAGKDADLCILDDSYRVRYTFVEGQCVYSTR